MTQPIDVPDPRVPLVACLMAGGKTDELESFLRFGVGQEAVNYTRQQQENCNNCKAEYYYGSQL